MEKLCKKTQGKLIPWKVHEYKCICIYVHFKLDHWWHADKKDLWILLNMFKDEQPLKMKTSKKLLQNSI